MGEFRINIDDITSVVDPVLVHTSLTTLLKEKLATSPEVSKFRSKAIKEAIPLLKDVVDEFAILKNDPQSDRSKLVKPLEQLVIVCKQAREELDEMPTEYIDKKSDKIKACSLYRKRTETVDALDTLRDALQDSLAKQENAASLSGCLDTVLKSYIGDQALLSYVAKDWEQYPAILGTATTVAIGDGIVILLFAQSNQQ